MKIQLFSLILLLVLTCTTSAGEVHFDTTLYSTNLDALLGQDSESRDQNHRGQRLALVLSGGGARGFAQIGVLKAIERRGLQVDLVVGTSMGGIIGGLWAAGFPADSIERLALTVDWGGFFSDRPGRSSLLQTQREIGERHLIMIRFDGLAPSVPTALTAGQKLTSLLNRLSIEANYRSDQDFDNLPIPLRVCAVDILAAEPVVLRSGNLADALRATMAVPLAFTPLDADSMLLMDGGLLRPIPVEVARDCGVQTVIAVNTTSGLLTRDEIGDPIDIANQTTTIMQLESRRRELAMADVIIEPDLGGHEATDFDGISDLIAAGERAADSILDRFSDALHSTASKPVGGTVCVDSLDISTSLADFNELGEFRSILDTNRFLSVDRIVAACDRIAETGSMQSLTAHLRVQDDGNILSFESVEFEDRSEIVIEGNSVLTDSELAESGCFPVERTGVGLQHLRNVISCVSDVYRSEGFDLVQVDSVRQRIGEGKTVLYISEGTVERVMITGNDRTKGWVIKRNFALKPGEPFNLRKAESGIQTIFATDLFERVNLNVFRVDDRARVQIEVKEKDYILMRLGGHYHEHYHAETFLDVADANVLGFSNEVFFRVHYGEKRKMYSLHLKADRIFETYFTYHINLYHDRIKRDRYENDESIGIDRERRHGARLMLGQQLARLGTLTAEARVERIRIDLPGFSGLMHRNLRSIIFRSRLDNMDRYPFPHSGGVFHGYFEIASDVFGGEDRYKKWFFEWRAQIPIWRGIGLQPDAAIGLSDVGLPRYEKFFLGGNRGLYGYHHESLEGDNMFRSSMGIRFKLPVNLYFTSRYDLGNVWNRFEELRFSQLKHSFGFELAMDTPLGPISASYGRAEDKYDRFYINVGYEF